MGRVVVVVVFQWMVGLCRLVDLDMFLESGRRSVWVLVTLGYVFPRVCCTAVLRVLSVTASCVVVGTYVHLV